MVKELLLLCMIQRKEQLHLRKGSGDGPQSAKHHADSNDDATLHSSSIPLSTAVADDVVLTHQPVNANGRTLVHRHGLANGMPVQTE